MSPSTQKTAAEQIALAKKEATEKALWLARLENEQAAFEKLGPLFPKALAAFEGALREAGCTPEESLVVASAITASTKRRLIVKCGAQTADTEEEMKRVAALHNTVHELDVLGGRLEKRVVQASAVVGVGRMTAADVEKGS